MAPGPATMASSPGQDSIGVAQGVSPPASAVNVKTQLDNNDQGSPADDSGGQRASGDEACSDEDDFVGETTNRNGKRRRPISVSIYSPAASSADEPYEAESRPATYLPEAESNKRKRADENPISRCELCKQRKVKCDRGQPSCGWCSRNGAQCEYKERKKPGLRAGYGRELEQRLDKLEQILRSHSEIIHATLELTAQRSNNGMPQALNPGPSSVRGSNASLPSTPHDPQQQPMFARSDSMRTQQAQAETALFLQRPSTGYPTGPQAMDFGIPPPTPGLAGHDGMAPVGSMAGMSPTGHTHISGMSGLSPGHSMPPSVAAQEYYNTANGGAPLASPTVNVSMGHTQQNQALSSDQDLPPYDLLYALVDLYFKHINTWCPILHRKSTLDSLFGPSMIEETDKILLHAIVATTLRYSTDARLTEERRRHYHAISKQRVLLFGMENSSVKSLQALVILSLDLCGDSNGPPGWNIMALITRSVVQLGLAVESSSFTVSPNFTSIYTLRAMILPEPRDFIEEESRRRLFWMIYLLDRYATIATAFEFALDDREIDRTLPCRDDLWMKNQKVETRWFSDNHHHPSQNGEAALDFQNDNPQNLGAFSYYIEILGILSKIHVFLKQPVDISALSDVEQWQMRYKQLDNHLTSWKFGLPGEFGNMAKLFQPNSAKQLNCGWVMLHATYHTAVIRLHSSAAYPTTRSPIFHPSYSASQRCHAAVENIQALCEFVAASPPSGGGPLLARLGPPFAFTLWVAARLLLVHGCTVEHKLSAQLPFFVDCLREMGRYWPVAARYCSLLERVLDEYRGAEAAAAAAGAHGENGGGGGGGGGGDGGQPASVKILADMRRTAFDLDFLISRQPVMHGGGHNAAGISNAGGGFNNNNNNDNAAGGDTPGPSTLGGGGGGGFSLGGRNSRYPSVTPARTPQPHDLEYLDVFDWFNLPRLPMGAAGNQPENNEQVVEGAAGADGGGNEFNITDFMVDANRDWFKQEGTKFMN